MITRAIVALNVLAFIWEIVVTHGAVIMGLPNQPTPVDNYVLAPSTILIDHQYYRIVTSAFLHASILHIGMNMIFLVSVGRFIEAAMGAWRTLLVYTISLVGSGLAVVYLSAPNTATLGASGAIFGMFGALFAIGLKLGEPGRQLIRANLGILVVNLVWSFAIPFIAKQAHVGGLIAGFIGAFALYYPPKPVHARVVDQTSGTEYESTLEVPSDEQHRY